jgi:hypothetical protein
MEKRYSLPLPIMVYFSLISLSFQSCGGVHSLPIQREEEPATTTTIAQEENQLITAGRGTRTRAKR